MNTITGTTAVDYLASDTFKDRVTPHKEDNTDKKRSYKLTTAKRSEFAFSPKTTTGLFVWFDCLPPVIEGVKDIQDISKKRIGTDLDRVFSGGAHKAKFKATIQTLDALSAVIDYLESLDQGSTNESNNWTTEELEAAVVAYVDMRSKEINKQPFTKKAYYTALSKKYGRTEKSYEYRMQNISYVYSLMGRHWVTGLKPAKNVGAKVAGQIETLIHRAEQTTSLPIVEFVTKVNAYKHLNGTLRAPKGNKTPSKSTSNVTQYNRDPEVVSWVINRAKGRCESCSNPAPFRKDDGTPFLEVHHLRSLADGGSDTTTNAVAICPNCHRELHYGANKAPLLNSIYSNNGQLIAE